MLSVMMTTPQSLVGTHTPLTCNALRNRGSLDPTLDWQGNNMNTCWMIVYYSCHVSTGAYSFMSYQP